MQQDITNQLKWYLANGEELWRTWTYSPDIEKRSLVNKSRKDFTCILGCQIPKGSQYVRFEIIAGGGCGVGNISIAVCTTHTASLAQSSTQKDENESILDNTVSWLESVNGSSFFEAVASFDSNVPD